ncbi:flagellar biosynthesis protein FlhF [Pseudodesulfovibrio sp. JC047]|uniref:flagellar biosynthesis protein FlhF n=1 Tax=Pseudodesulfovibrio sp. JC047 TaxID=2683199 RepID=UPI0013D1EEB5|nr:flagellar biosynthesis protein FlhF [Pseudodesulfovibrio sp. JC047]NDV20597.1 flagellar biosynthesis protein FlhF [Pseudodesulfovibrio sp. JC047]
MRMKTFRAATTTAAFAKVKADLGEDAVILSNETITDNGCKCCEVVAAIDHTPSSSSSKQTRDDVVDEALQDSAGWQREWSQIKSQIMALMKPQIELNRLSPKQKIALEYLEREDVNEKVLARLYCALRDEPKRSIMAALDPLLKATPFEQKHWTAKFQAFTGPGGAGKTTSLVRLALQFKKNHPRTRICLATADGGRGKGRLVLKHYAELSGLAFREIITREDFALLHKESDQFDVIFVDLPGLPGNTTLEEWLQLYGMHGCRDMSMHLVLNPYYSEAQFERFFEKYKSEQLASVIWTKLDEACTFGAVLNMACASGLPVSALSYGASLKNSIKAASEEMVWRLLFMRTLPNGDIQP